MTKAAANLEYEYSRQIYADMLKNGYLLFSCVSSLVSLEFR